MGDGRSGDAEIAPSILEASAVWAKIGLLSFGGPAAQIALMHKIVVEERGWLSEQRYLAALGFCMLLPGPEAMQLATYAGWRLHGLVGGLIAGLLFVLPGAVVVLALAAIYALYGDVPLVSALFLGVKATVLVIVIEALMRVARKALHRSDHWIVAATAFTGIFFFALPFPLIVFGAALYGLVRFESDGHKAPLEGRSVSWRETLFVVLVWLAIWWVPLLALEWSSAPEILGEIGRFFSTLAVVTFGGAYSVLAFMAQDVVGRHEWLTAGEMMDGLGLAETTPGPLILVTEFVAFLAAFDRGGLLLGVVGAGVALWATFVPCFLWIFACGPHIEWISAQPRLRGALAAITAAVVGVILNLSVWFALHVLFAEVTASRLGILTLWQPDPSTVDWRVFGLTLVAAYLIFRRHWGIASVLALSACSGALMMLFA